MLIDKMCHFDAILVLLERTFQNKLILTNKHHGGKFRASESSDRQLGFDFVLKYTKKYPSTSVFKLHTFFTMTD